MTQQASKKDPNTEILPNHVKRDQDQDQDPEHSIDKYSEMEEQYYDEHQLKNRRKRNTSIYSSKHVRQYVKLMN